MRVALLVIMEGAPEGGTPRALLQVGGATVARRQLSTALSLECRRIVCLTKGVTAPVLELQHAAEAGGAAFHVASSVGAISGRITADDEVFVFSEGLLPDTEITQQALGSGPGVLVQPAESGLGAGFERIDLNHAAAGLVRMPGRLVDRLFDLPAECDVPSALTRIALQGGVPMRNLPRAARDTSRWQLIRGEEDAHVAEDALISAHLARWPSTTPGLLLARAAVTTFGPGLLHAGRGALSVAAGFFALLAAALGAGWLGLVALGLALLGVAWASLKVLELLGSIEADALEGDPARLSWTALLAWLLDAVLVILLVWRAPMLPWETLMERAFPPLVLLGLLILVPLVLRTAWLNWCEDRLVVCLLLALCAILGVLGPAIAVLALILIVLAIALGYGLAGLTRP